MQNCQDMVTYFYSVIFYLLDLHLPLVRSSFSNLDKPWVTPEFRQLIKQRQRAFMSSQTVLYRKLRNKVQRVAAQLRKTYYTRKVQALHSADLHSWWIKTKQFLHPIDSNPLLHLEQSSSTSSLADEINEFFVSVSEHLPSFDHGLLAELTSDFSDDYIIEPAEVEQRLSRIKIHKAPGPDGIPNWFLRDAAPLICEPLAAIFNASLREGYFPPIWKSAEVVPVPKCYPPVSIQSDLRPISLLPTLAKILESIVGEWLLPFVETTLDPCQFGCRRGRSTTHALIAVLHAWMSSLDAGGSARALFVDFRKAFDLVNHNILFQKLSKYNLPHFLLTWFGSYLSCRQQRVRANSLLSSWKELKGSMPQGSWLGPLSFLVLIDDLSAACAVHKYVDDTTLSELLPKSSSASNMQVFLAALLDWAAENDMQINSTKTKEMVLGPLSRVDLPLLTTPTGSVERVTSFKLLGVTIDASLSWSAHINNVVAKATKRLYFLKQLRRAGVSQDHLLYFYIMAIRPVLEYCAPVWHYSLTKAQTEQLEAVQKRALRVIFQLSPDTSYFQLLEIADLNSLASRRDELSRNFFHLITFPTSCLFHLLPPARPRSVIGRLRSSQPFPMVNTRTKKYCSFIQFGLNHYQEKSQNYS